MIQFCSKTAQYETPAFTFLLQTGNFLDTRNVEIDRHDAAFKRIFAILFIASTLKITEKGHQYEDMCRVTSIKIVDVDVERREDIILVNFVITFKSK